MAVDVLSRTVLSDLADRLHDALEKADASLIESFELEGDMREMNGHLQRLYEVIDTLWGELPAEIVTDLAEDRPDAIEICMQAHQITSHAS